MRETNKHDETTLRSRYADMDAARDQKDRDSEIGVGRICAFRIDSNVQKPSSFPVLCFNRYVMEPFEIHHPSYRSSTECSLLVNCRQGVFRGINDSRLRVTFLLVPASLRSTCVVLGLFV